jgi:hypothetical protein
MPATSRDTLSKRVLLLHQQIALQHQIEICQARHSGPLCSLPHIKALSVTKMRSKTTTAIQDHYKVHVVPVPISWFILDPE